jgi:hypothetical protein
VARDIKAPRDEASRSKKHWVASPLLSVTDRLQFITRQAKKILLIDVPDCSAANVEKIVGAVLELVTTRPLGSVLIFTDLDVPSDQNATRLMKETAVFDKPYVKKSAWAGAENLPEGFPQSLSTFFRAELRFSEREAQKAEARSFGDSVCGPQPYNTLEEGATTT